MRKIIVCAGVMGGIAIMAALAFFLSGDGLEKETSGWVSDAANSIAYAWDPQELKSRAEPGLIKAMQSQGQSVEQLFAIYGRLGKPKAPLVCVYKSSAALSSYVTVTYICDADYENGAGSMTLTLRKHEDGDWKIYYIKVASDLFDQLQNR